MTINDDEKEQGFIDALTTSDDFYFLDTNVIGSNFFENKYNNFSQQTIRVKFTIMNNLDKRLLRQTRNRVGRNLTLITTYETIITTDEVIEELEIKNKRSRYAASLLGLTGRHPKQHGEIAMTTAKIRKERKILEEIIEREQQITEVLRERKYTPPQNVISFEALTIGAYQNLRKKDKREKKNYNDEKILATALYIATVVGEGVVLVSRDRGIEHVLREVTRQVHADNSQSPLFLDALNKGKINIMKDLNKEKRYAISFSSVDFKKGRSYTIPQPIRERVERCEAVIRQARPSPAAEPQQPAQSLYSSTA